jgi:pimeloyl-ACP methyl ester carboxylesterase
VLIPNGIYLFDDFECLAGERTLIFYDTRNRGRSDHVRDGAQLARGIHHDVDDLDAVRRHFGVTRVDLIGHSYVGVTVVLYAMKYPARIGRLVQIGAMSPSQARQYSAHLTNVDGTLREALAALAELEKERQGLDPKEFCRRFWSVLRIIYVADPADAGKIKWSRCDLPNERNFMKCWLEYILPSIQKLDLTEEDMTGVKAPVLTIHGSKDRSAPYGGGREWALRLANARLLTVGQAAHVPWIEAPELTFGSIKTFLDGTWPEAAEKVTSLDPDDPSIVP